jgi:4-amino-4-deoxychorismate lyase
MFPFFETIRYSNSVAENLFFHQQRVGLTFIHYGKTINLDLLQIDFKSDAILYGAVNDCVYKCKIMYDLKGKYTISFEPYQIRPIKTFTILDIGTNEYSIKLTDRTWINDYVKSVETDEVIFIKDGLLKDSSYANIVLFDGREWITPANPLLLGTKRALLISEKKITEKEIHVGQLKEYTTLKLINAMMHWDESPTIDLV